jgi:DNA-binding protein H-NS
MSLQEQLYLERCAIRKEVLEDIRACVEEFGFESEELFVQRRDRSKRRPRYLDPLTGITWTGAGKEPLWIRGKDRTLYEIPAPADKA